MLQTTALYAGLLGLFSIVLAGMAGRVRRRKNVSFGDGDDAELRLAMRRHANFIEYVPLILILLGILELNNVSNVWLHIFGLLLLVTRISHAFGLRVDAGTNITRVIGAGGTILILIATSMWSIVSFF